MYKEKLFYKYQNLDVIKDNDGNLKNYTIENLANNQLFFKYPNQFNDPFDSRFYCYYLGTEEQVIDFIVRSSSYNRDRIQAKELIQLNLASGKFELRDGLIYFDCKMISSIHKDANLHGDISDKDYPKVCCFSETCNDILMWSHYANYHKGICLRFRPFIDPFDLDRSIYFLPLYTTSPLIIRNIPFHEVGYTDEISTVNMFDYSRVDKINRVLSSKFSHWWYEHEYRMLLHAHELENDIIHYEKEDLEGIVFGLKISYEDAKLVYETVKNDYLDEGFSVNLYEAKEVYQKYTVDIELITDMEKYISNRPKSI